MAATKSNTVSETEEKRVQVKLPRLPGNANQDVLIGVEGKNYIIKRGEYVSVPMSVKEVIDLSEMAEAAAYKFSEEQKSKAKESK